MGDFKLIQGDCLEVMREMKVKGLVPWYGGKRTLARNIVAELGKHAMYVEPACGSMAVLLAKEPSGSDIVNDLHGDLINLAMVVASERWRELHEKLRRIFDCEVIFENYKEQFMAESITPPEGMDRVGDDHIERAALYMVVSWQGRNGVSGTRRGNYQKARQWTPGGGSGAVRWTNAVDSMPAWHERLRRVNIYRMDMFELIEKIEDDPRTAIYVDPPYLFGKRTGRTGGARYVHEFAEEDHVRLAAALSRFERARVVVSYYEEPELMKLYPDWTMKRLEKNKNMGLMNKRGSTPTKAAEVLLINGRSYVDDGGLF